MKSFRNAPFYLDESAERWVENTFRSMTQEEKIGQVFCLVGYGWDEEYLTDVAQKYHAGAFMCRAMEESECVRTVTHLQEHSRIPMLISGNIEAGGCGILQNGTRVGNPMQIAATQDVSLAEKLGEICAKEGNAAGANWTYAPVCDIDYNFRCPITNTRTFGSDPERVAQMAVAYIRAVQKNGLAATAKHFPGDGCDERDQHLVTTVNPLTCEEWDNTYGQVYRACIDAGVKTVMAGHIMLPAYSKAIDPALRDEDILPATLSRELLQGLLRQKLHFGGLICSDATAMAGMAIPMPRDIAIPTAIAAGCDMLTFTRDTEEDFSYLRRGIERGILTQERLDEAVRTVLALKASLGLHRKITLPEKNTILQAEHTQSHRQAAQTVADRCITLVKEEAGVLPLSAQKYPRVLLYSLNGGENAMGYGAQAGAAEKFCSLLRSRGYRVEVFTPPAGMEGMMQSFEQMKTRCDLILYLANYATRSNQTTVRIEWKPPMGADVPVYMHTIPTVFISLENPYHLLDVPRVRTYINTYGSSDAIIEHLVDKLEGKSPFCGISPVDPFCGKWDTRL